ncbi:MAG: ribosome small subunit-dependent GTPase A, partial [Myxococcaceae bacterium]
MSRASPNSLADWGWTSVEDAALAKAGRAGSTVGRVIAEHAGLFRVVTTEATLLARPTGKLRQRIERDPALRPIVGDWVVLGSIHAQGESSLGEVLPRRTFISRKDPDNAIVQPIVANVDQVFIVTTLTGDLSL